MRSALVSMIVASLMLPMAANAANVFGGRVGLFLPCFNIATYNQVGPPRQGLYIYIPKVTKLYPYGAPGPGKWVLGLYGIPYFCIVTIAPLFVLPGIAMTMVGTSH